MKVDFYKEFQLERPIGGIIRRITSPKGIRTVDDRSSDGYSYRLHTELCAVYTSVPMELNSGLYLVSDICIPQNRLVWNWYLFIIVDWTADSQVVYPIAEFLDQKDSSWVKDALPTLKKFFSGEKLDPIVLTKYSHEEQKTRRSWKASKK